VKEVLAGSHDVGDSSAACRKHLHTGALLVAEQVRV
jgi:hypothetical protein